MKLSQIEKRIPQTLTNSKDIVQKDRKHARRSSRARSTHGQENKAWALYKKKSIPGVLGWPFWGPIHHLSKATLSCRKILDRRQLFFLAAIVLPSQLQFPRALRTTTTNYRVSFIDLYSVFSRNFRIVFLSYLYKHCNFTGTVLRYYPRAWVTCGGPFPIVLGNFWRLEQIFAVLATPSKFCLSEQLLSKI